MSLDVPAAHRRGRGRRVAPRSRAASPPTSERGVEVADELLDARARRARRRGPRPHRGPARRRQDDARPRARALDRPAVRAHPVHRRPAARRRRRHQRLQPARGPLRVPARADLRERRHRRRGQPRVAQDAVGPARVHAGAAGHRRRPHARARPAVPRPRHAEPGRVRGHLPAARGAGRPLHDAAVARLPERAAPRPTCSPPTRSATASPSSSRWRAPPTSLAAQQRRRPRPRLRRAAPLHRRAAAAHARGPAARARRLAARRGSCCCAPPRRARCSQGRDHALPDDVQALAQPVLAHRLVLAPEAVDATPAQVVADALDGDARRS